MVASGTATGTSSTSLSDSGASWTTDQWKDRWVTRGGYQGYINSNTAQTVNIPSWDPYWTGVPATGAYTIAKRSLVGSSLSKSFTDGYIAAANVPAKRIFRFAVHHGAQQPIAHNAAKKLPRVKTT